MFTFMKLLFLLTFLNFVFIFDLGSCNIFHFFFLGATSMSINHRLSCMIEFMKHNLDTPWWIIFGMMCGIMWCSHTAVTHFWNILFAPMVIKVYVIYHILLCVPFVVCLLSNFHLLSHSFHCYPGKCANLLISSQSLYFFQSFSSVAKYFIRCNSIYIPIHNVCSLLHDCHSITLYWSFSVLYYADIF